MKKIGIVMVALVIVTFMIGTAALMMPAIAKADVTTTRVEMTINKKVWVPCAMDGEGEWVPVIGDLNALFHTTFPESADLHSFSSQVNIQTQGISGIGETSGDTYQLIGVIHESFNGIVGEQETLVVIGRVIGPGPGNNLRVLMKVLYTVNANGEVIIDFLNMEVECK